MAKKTSKKYTVVASVFYMREATASYTIMAASDKEALKKMRDIIKSSDLMNEAEDFSDIDNPFNFSGHFTMARGDEVPDDDGDPAIVVEREDFENAK